MSGRFRVPRSSMLVRFPNNMMNFPTNNRYGEWIYQPVWRGQPFPVDRRGIPLIGNIESVTDKLCKHCGITVPDFVHHQCRAINAVCYRCKFRGHFSRMCENNEKPSHVKKTKSKSKVKRDQKRMKDFIDRKRNSASPVSELPFQEIEDAEISTQFGEYREQCIKDHLAKSKHEIRKLQSEKVTLKSENSQLKNLNDILNNELCSLKIKIENISADHHQINILQNQIEELKSQHENAVYKLKTKMSNLETKAKSLQCIDFFDSKCVDCKHHIQKLREDNSSYRLDVQRLEYELSLLESNNGPNCNRAPERSTCIRRARRSRPFDPSKSRGRYAR